MVASPLCQTVVGFGGRVGVCWDRLPVEGSVLRREGAPPCVLTGPVYWRLCVCVCADCVLCVCVSGVFVLFWCCDVIVLWCRVVSYWVHVSVCVCVCV